MKIRKICATIIITFSLLVILTGCGTKKEEETVQNIISIPVTFLVNPDTGKNENQELVDAFNKEYEGVYYLDVEWITDTAEGYRAKIKTLNGLDKLPAVITDVGFDADFYQLLIENNRLVNLKPFIMADEQWKMAYGERDMETYTEADGNIYVSPSANASMSYGGFFYNKVLFEQAGIMRFPKTWQEFWECVEYLENLGITPLAIHGGNSYWTPLLITTGYIAGTPEGLAFLETQYPQDYKEESAVELFDVLKRMYQYADADALYIDREESVKRFQRNEAAITANGGWMITNFEEEEKENIGFAPFPENVLLLDMKMSVWAVTSGYSEEITKGAVEFLKFRALQEHKQEEEYFIETEDTILEEEYKKAVLNAENFMPNYQLKWESHIQEEFLVNNLPSYIEGQITKEEFLNGLNNAVKEINAEK